MRTRLLVGLTVAIVFAFVAAVAPTRSAEARGVTIVHTTLTGAAEFPGPGDPDGRGIFVAVLFDTKICYALAVRGIERATAAHIHVGAVGTAPPMNIVVPLEPPVPHASHACVAVAPALIAAIREDPENYYVNVHNTPFPGGALRGQLN